MFDRLKLLLRPPEQKASRTARLIAIESGGRARWTPRDYAALAAGRRSWHVAVESRSRRLQADLAGEFNRRPVRAGLGQPATAQREA